jgi:hypothetical protein
VGMVGAARQAKEGDKKRQRCQCWPCPFRLRHREGYTDDLAFHYCVFLLLSFLCFGAATNDVFVILFFNLPIEFSQRVLEFFEMGLHDEFTACLGGGLQIIESVSGLCDCVLDDGFAVGRSDFN